MACTAQAKRYSMLCEAQIPLHRLSLKLSRGENRGHKPSRYVADFVAKSA